MDKKLMLATLRNILLAGAYVFGISQLMFYGEQLFSKVDNNLAPFAILLLLCLSAAIVGSLVFGPAVYLFFENKKSESVKSAIYSIIWLFLVTFVVFATLLIIK
ncbi:MAG: hypothetical protein WC107_01125 [Patescibacteria group bacterium]